MHLIENTHFLEIQREMEQIMILSVYLDYSSTEHLLSCINLAIIYLRQDADRKMRKEKIKDFCLLHSYDVCLHDKHWLWLFL